jgi:hypothetical protein
VDPVPAPNLDLGRQRQHRQAGGGVTETANKVENANLISRLSKMQKEILTYLVTAPQPLHHPNEYGTYNTKNVPRTGDIIDALHRQRTPSNYAVVSRALSRLQARGLINSFHGAVFYSQGKGHCYAINPEARVTVNC